MTRPEPITVVDGVETIPLPGGYSVELWPDQRSTLAFEGRHFITYGMNYDMARATHAALTAQADEIDRLKAENAELRDKARSLLDAMDFESALQGGGTWGGPKSGHKEAQIAVRNARLSLEAAMATNRENTP